MDQPKSVRPGRAATLVVTAACALVLLVALGARLSLAFAAQPMDDALITLKYASNLLGGVGFVFNAGERVMGSTAPLYALLLVPVLAVAGSPLGALKAVPIAADAASLALILSSRSFGANVRERLPYAAAFGCAWFMIAGVGYGMETQLFMLLILAIRELLERRHFVSSGVLVGLCALVRPEAVIVAAVFCHNLRTRRAWTRATLGAVVPVTLWIAFASYYFGDFVPHSIHAKSTLGHSSIADWWRFFIVRNPLSILLWLGSALSLIVARRRSATMDLTIVGWALALFYLITRPVFYGVWYFPPVGLCVAIGATTFAVTVLRWIAHRVIPMRSRGKPSSNWLSALTAAAWVVLCAITLSKVHANARSFRENVDGVYLPVARLIADDPRSVSTIASDIGYVGYFCDCTLIDAGSLVSPSVLEHYLDPDPTKSSLIARFLPDYYVAPVNNGVNAAFVASDDARHYDAVARFQKFGDNVLPVDPDPSEEYRRAAGYIGDFVVYRRR